MPVQILSERQQQRLIVTEFGPAGRCTAADIVDDEGTVWFSFAEPVDRTERRDWTEQRERDFRAVVRGFSWDLAAGNDWRCGGYTLVFDPGRDQEHEDVIGMALDA